MGYPVSGDAPSERLKATVFGTSPVCAILQGFPGAGLKRVLTPWAPADDPGDPHCMDYDLLTCECAQVINEGSTMLRIDQRFTEKITSFMRFSYDRSVETRPLSVCAADMQQKIPSPGFPLLGLCEPSAYPARARRPAHMWANTCAPNIARRLPVRSGGLSLSRGVDRSAQRWFHWRVACATTPRQ